MSNVPYYFSYPDIGIRKGIVEAHLELHKQNKTIYKSFPIQVSLYLSFKNRKNIENFFNATIIPMETFTEIERLKKLESIHNKTSFRKAIDLYTKVSIILFTLYKVITPKQEWKYKHKLIYLPSIPFKDLKIRVLWGAFGVFLLNFSYLVPDLLMCLCYPSLLSDLQIGEDFELGYWSTKFVKGLK